MKRYIGELIWFSLAALLLLIITTLGGCYASIEKEICVEVPFRSCVPEGRSANEGPQYRPGPDAGRLETVTCPAPAPSKLGS